jgi:hypothetical protein
LEILSIRGQEKDNAYPHDAHDAACKLPHTIIKYAPKTLTTLELRFPFRFLDRLASAFKDNNLSIRKIGIDLGAWVQEYPRRSPNLCPSFEEDLKKPARAAARKLDSRHTKWPMTKTLALIQSGGYQSPAFIMKNLHRKTVPQSKPSTISIGIITVVR